MSFDGPLPDVLQMSLSDVLQMSFDGPVLRAFVVVLCLDRGVGVAALPLFSD